VGGKLSVPRVRPLIACPPVSAFDICRDQRESADSDGDADSDPTDDAKVRQVLQKGCAEACKYDSTAAWSLIVVAACESWPFDKSGGHLTRPGAGGSDQVPGSVARP
jgi:hypothetical protein